MQKIYCIFRANYEIIILLSFLIPIQIFVSVIRRNLNSQVVHVQSLPFHRVILSSINVSVVEISTPSDDLELHPNYLVVFRYIPDNQVILFIHAAAYDLTAAKKLIETYYKLRTQYKHYFSQRDPLEESIVQAANVG